MSIAIIFLLIAVNSIKLGQGFDFDAKAVFIPQNKWALLKGIGVSIFLVPMLFALLILLFHPPFPISAALIIMAVCPAADLSIQQVQKLGGDVPLAMGVQVISAIISIATIPILLKLFELFFHAHVDIAFQHVIREVAIAQFIPMSVGLGLRQFFPSYAWLARFIIKAGTLLLITCFIFLFIQNLNAFSEFKFVAYIMVIFATMSAFSLGVIFSGKNIKRQISLSIESSLRNPGLGYLLATENFPLERANLAMVPYVLTTVLVVVLCTILLKQSHARLTHQE